MTIDVHTPRERVEPDRARRLITCAVQETATRALIKTHVADWRISFPLGIDLRVRYHRRLNKADSAQVFVEGIPGVSRRPADSQRLGTVLIEAGRLGEILQGKLLDAGFAK